MAQLQYCTVVLNMTLCSMALKRCILYFNIDLFKNQCPIRYCSINQQRVPLVNDSVEYTEGYSPKAKLSDGLRTLYIIGGTIVNPVLNSTLLGLDTTCWRGDQDVKLKYSVHSNNNSGFPRVPN